MLTVTDLFCGAGGSGLGAHAVPGVELRMAANHWRLAVDTHAHNFPDSDHDCADISQASPRRYPRTDILWASPECTNHSVAKGRRRTETRPDLFGDTLSDEAAERSRATMWDVPRFAECHRYRAVIVENVVDAARWIMWPAWLQAMGLLGYRHRVVWLNSMHAPGITVPRAPQSRDRMYVVFWRAGDLRTSPISRNVPTVTASGNHLGLLVPAGGTSNDDAHPVTWPMRTRNTREGEGLVMPVKAREKPRARAVGEAPRPQTARPRDALVVPYYGTAVTYATVEPLHTVSTVDRFGVAFIAELRGGGSDARDVRQPLATVTASGNHHMLVRHDTARGNPARMCTPATEPARTLTTTGHQSLIGWPAAMPEVEDCTFRMLEPGEIARAMAFHHDYRVLGNRREQVRQLGNAVTPPAAEWLITAVVAALTGAAA